MKRINYVEETEIIKGCAGRDGEEEVQKLRAVKDERVLKDSADPRRPTQREVEDHQRTHLPYRNWCPMFVFRPRNETWATVRRLSRKWL